MLNRLRSELEEAMRTAAGRELQFRLGPVELEFQLGVTSEGAGEAGIRFWVITLGAKGSRAREQVQTVRLTLNPHLPGQPGKDVNVGVQGQLGE
jgi:hypothetical protein